MKLPSHTAIIAESEHYWSDKSIWLHLQMLQYVVMIPAKKKTTNHYTWAPSSSKLMSRFLEGKAYSIYAGQPTFIKLRHNTVFVQWGVVLPVGKRSARLRLELGGLVRNVDLGPRRGMRGCSECQTVWGNQGAQGYDGRSLCPLRWCFGLVVLCHHRPLRKC